MATVFQSMLWKDLLAVLFYLPEFVRNEASAPVGSCWRMVVSTHVAATVCRLLGLVFVYADNKEPLILKLLACPSAEELAGILTTQVSSLVSLNWEISCSVEVLKI
ncbi:hypothetical protein DUNSADRAFT_14214 [Dunaliella salina]|uniref:Uncharacterized protein n=1 Tax=Dunaliella salina TaxID=3046 RepID=A0ABQ7G7U9_DUNSA|nr:hypothetical protein DUNSADRAFT_14214 [Dunaliella salina]|eukprot:KAF5830675.1 hypothetical protein DUNSADRAFT_14214 [Dunaliella salina]